MGGVKSYSRQRIDELEQVVKDRWTPEIFRRFQCVWLRHALGLTAVEIASALDLNVSTVRRVQAEFMLRGKAIIDGKGNRGGRRNQYMTFEEEADFLREHAASVSDGGILRLVAALEIRIGMRVHKTTVYRLLERHGWRKVAPRHYQQEGGAEVGPEGANTKGRPAMQEKGRANRNAHAGRK